MRYTNLYALLDRDTEQLICHGYKQANVLVSVAHFIEDNAKYYQPNSIVAVGCEGGGRWYLGAPLEVNVTEDRAIWAASHMPGATGVGFRPPRDEEAFLLTFEHDKATLKQPAHFHVEHGVVSSTSNLHNIPTEMHDCGGILVAKSDGAIIGYHYLWRSDHDTIVNEFKPLTPSVIQSINSLSSGPENFRRPVRV